MEWGQEWQLEPREARTMVMMRIGGEGGSLINVEAESSKLAGALAQHLSASRRGKSGGLAAHEIILGSVCGVRVCDARSAFFSSSSSIIQHGGQKKAPTRGEVTMQGCQSLSGERVCEPPSASSLDVLRLAGGRAGAEQRRALARGAAAAAAF